VKKDASEKGEEQESNLGEHQRVGAFGAPAETSCSNRDVKSGEIEVKAQKTKVRKRGWPKGKPRKLR